MWTFQFRWSLELKGVFGLFLQCVLDRELQDQFNKFLSNHSLSLTCNILRYMFANREKTEQSKLARDVVNLLIQLTFSWTKLIRRRTNHNPKTHVTSQWQYDTNKKNNRKCAATQQRTQRTHTKTSTKLQSISLGLSSCKLPTGRMCSLRRLEHHGRGLLGLLHLEPPCVEITPSLGRAKGTWTPRKMEDFKRERFFSFKKKPQKTNRLVFCWCFYVFSYLKGNGTVCSVLQGWRHVSSLDKHTSAFVTRDSHGMIASSVIEIKGDSCPRNSLPNTHFPWSIFVA